MNIMFEDSITDDVKSKYMLLPLDTFYFADADKKSTAYCLIENTPIQEMFSVDQYLDLHQNLIKNYYLRNWNYCEQAVEQLLGRWNGEVDSFYNEMDARVKNYKEQDPGSDWTGVLPVVK
jgi:hypothetical protein